MNETWSTNPPLSEGEIKNRNRVRVCSKLRQKPGVWLQVNEYDYEIVKEWQSTMTYTSEIGSHEWYSYKESADGTFWVRYNPKTFLQNYGFYIFFMVLILLGVVAVGLGWLFS